MCKHNFFSSVSVFNVHSYFLRPFWVLNMLSMQGPIAVGFNQKYLSLCSKDERSYGFGTTWGWASTTFPPFKYLIRINVFNRINRSQDGLIIDVVTQCYQQILPIDSKGLSEYRNAPGLTSWPDRWILFRSAWQIRLQYPEQPHQSRPSRHHLLVPWATSPHLVLQCLSQSEKNSTKKEREKEAQWCALL